MSAHSDSNARPRAGRRAERPGVIAATASVGLSLHNVGTRRQARALSWLAPLLRIAAGALFITLLGACADDPERLLCSRWQESEWSYERLDPPPERMAFNDLLTLTRQRDRRIVRHEAEYWEFRCDRSLIISKLNGEKLRRRWLLKGRGHVLAIAGDDPSELELYDVKELNRRELVLHYDIGMELRGIARLSFRKAEAGASRATRAVAREPFLEEPTHVVVAGSE